MLTQTELQRLLELPAFATEWTVRGIAAEITGRETPKYFWRRQLEILRIAAEETTPC